MVSKELDFDLLRQLRPAAVQDYVRATGWTRVQGIRGEIAVYHKADLLEVIVPLNPDYIDFGRRMSEVITELSEAENRPPQELLDDLLQPTADL